jgi:DNA-binding FadR family transcriptional regulator
MRNESQSEIPPFQRNLRQQLVDAIGGQIVGGSLKPGEYLPSEEVLLARYGVSRTVLREAINVLSGKGLLSAKPKLGTFVQPRSEWSQLDPAVLSWLDEYNPSAPESGLRTLDDLMEIRRIIEPSSVALAATRRTEEDLVRISAAYDAMARAGNVAETFMEADLAFHIACLNAAHNDFLLPVAHAIRTAMWTSLRVTNRNPALNRVSSLPLHQAILDAIVAGDPRAATLAMERHLDDTEARRVSAGHRTDRSGAEAGLR